MDTIDDLKYTLDPDNKNTINTTINTDQSYSA